MHLQAADLPARLPSAAQPVYLVMGDEPLLVLEAAAAVRAQLRELGYAERIVLHPGAGFDWPQLSAEAGAMSLFAQRRLLEIELPGGKPGTDGAAAITDFVAAAAADTALLLVAQTEGAPSRTAAWVKKVEAAGLVVSCRPLKPQQLNGWLAARARGAGLRIEREALAWLARQVEGNLLAAAQEIAKLPLLGLKGEIGLDALRAAVSDSARFAAYELPDMALTGNLAGTLRMLQRLREEDVQPVVLVSLFARDLRTLHAAAMHAQALGAERACERAGIWRMRMPAFRRALQVHDLAAVRSMLSAVGRLDRLAKSAPPARAWEELLNLSVRLAAPRRAAA